MSELIRDKWGKVPNFVILEHGEQWKLLHQLSGRYTTLQTLSDPHLRRGLTFLKSAIIKDGWGLYGDWGKKG